MGSRVCGLSSCGAWAQLSPWLVESSRTRAEPVSPALAGQLLTTGPPVKPPELVFSTSILSFPLPRRCWTFPLLRPAKPLSPLLQPPPNFSALLISSKTPVPTTPPLDQDLKSLIQHLKGSSLPSSGLFPLYPTEIPQPLTIITPKYT